MNDDDLTIDDLEAFASRTPNLTRSLEVFISGWPLWLGGIAAGIWFWRTKTAADDPTGKQGWINLIFGPAGATIGGILGWW